MCVFFFVFFLLFFFFNLLKHYNEKILVHNNMLKSLPVLSINPPQFPLSVP